jgi:transposase
VRKSSVFARAFGLANAVVEDVVFADDGASVVVHVRPNSRMKKRCGVCQRRSPGYDRGDGRRRWRATDFGSSMAFIEADAPRVNCQVHGPTVAYVPWARHGARHTRDFDETAAWLSIYTSKSTVQRFLRIAWETVAAIVVRVLADIDRDVDRLEGLRRIGIDEISYKRGHRYLTVVVDHDQGRLVWAAAGKDAATLSRFFDDLGEDRARQLTHVSADMAHWIGPVVRRRAPQAVMCADPFHVVKWAQEALDIERRRVWNQAHGRRRDSRAKQFNRNESHSDARTIKRARFAIIKNPEDLTERQHEQLAWIAKHHPRLYRSYLLKEGLRLVFKVKGDEGKQLLEDWIAWARRSQIPAFVELQRRITAHKQAIHATLDHHLSQGLIESTNTKIRVLTRVAFGFHGPEPLIALAMLALGGHRPQLPGRP